MELERSMHELSKKEKDHNWMAKAAKETGLSLPDNSNLTVKGRLKPTKY